MKYLRLPIQLATLALAALAAATPTYQVLSIKTVSGIPQDYVSTSSSSLGQATAAFHGTELGMYVHGGPVFPASSYWAGDIALNIAWTVQCTSTVAPPPDQQVVIQETTNLQIGVSASNGGMGSVIFQSADPNLANWGAGTVTISATSPPNVPAIVQTYSGSATTVATSVAAWTQTSPTTWVGTTGWYPVQTQWSASCMGSIGDNATAAPGISYYTSLIKLYTVGGYAVTGN